MSVTPGKHSQVSIHHRYISMSGPLGDVALGLLYMKKLPTCDQDPSLRQVLKDTQNATAATCFSPCNYVRSALVGNAWLATASKLKANMWELVPHAVSADPPKPRWRKRVDKFAGRSAIVCKL